MKTRSGRLLAGFLLLFCCACATAPARKGKGAQPPAQPHPHAPSIEHVLFDSDGAEFWDDGAALAMLLSDPAIHVDGITLVFGNHFPRDGAMYLGQVLKAAGTSEIPMYLGAAQPLQNSKTRMQALEKEVGDVFWKGAWSREKLKLVQRQGPAPKKRSAVSFIVEALNKSPEPVTVVAIGPLTNLAQAIARDRKIVAKIRRVLIMGGAIHVPGNTTKTAELNFLLDAEAAHAVLASGVHEIDLFPLDLSNEGKIGRLKFQELAAVPGPFGAMLAEQFGKKFEDPSFKLDPWDTTVAAYLLDSSYVTSSEQLTLQVNTELGTNYGSVEVKEGAPKIRVMTGMNFGKYFDALKRGLSREAH